MKLFKAFVFLCMICWLVTESCNHATNEAVVVTPVTAETDSVTQSVKTDSAAMQWKTYSNTKYGFSFQYPAAWVQNGSETEAFNLSGVVTSIEVNFVDSISECTLTIAYHLAPQGATLFKYAAEQFQTKSGWYKEKAEQLTVAGNTAYKAVIFITADGKGHALNPSIKVIVVDFPDKNQTGEFQLQFKIPDGKNGHEQTTAFEQVLSSFILNN